MSLLLAYTFNDNNASSFADFSGNKQTGSGTIGSIVAGQNYGYAANFSATNNYITVTPSNFSGISALTYFTSIYITSINSTPGALNYLISQANSFQVYINGTGNIVFKVWNTAGGAYITLTSATTVSAGNWYTIGCVADGTNMYIYINGTQDANTTTNSGIGISNTAVYIGNDSNADTSNTFNGYIDTIEVRSNAADYADMASLNTSPGGVELTNLPHNFATGDLLIDNTNTYQAVVTWVVDTSNFYIYPLTLLPDAFTKVGNVYQTARQYYMVQTSDFDGNGNGQISIISPIAGFADYSSPATSYTIDKGGVNALITAVTGSTAVTPSQGDDSTKIATTDFVQNNMSDYHLPMFSSMGSAILAQTCNPIMITQTAGISSGTIVFESIWLKKTATLTGVKWFQAGAGVYTANNYNGVGLYSVSGSTLTLVASSTNDGSIWKATSNTYSNKSFTSQYSAATGLYYIALIYCSSSQTSLPQLGGTLTMQGNGILGLDYTNNNAILAILTGQTALPSPTQALSGLSVPATGSIRWLALY